MKDFLEREKDIAAEEGISDGVGDSDIIVFGKVMDKLDDAPHLIADDRQIGVREHLEERGVLAAPVEIVQPVEIGPQVTDHHPATFRFLQYLQ